MLKNIFLGICLLTFTFSKAQFGINATTVKSITSTSTACFENKLKPEDYKKLKKMTTYFVCAKGVSEDMAALQELFDKAWGYNPIVVIGQDDIQNHIREKNAAFFTPSIATLDGNIREVYYELWSIKDQTKSIDSYNMIQYCRFNIYYLCEYSIKKIELKDNNALFDYLYNEAEMRNFKPGIVANYLKFLESYLNEEKYLYCHSRIADLAKLDDLKESTLYITSNVKNKYSIKAMKMSCELDEEQEVDKLMEKYPYKYEFISYEDLNDKIINGDNFNYAICLKSNLTTKHISIFNSKSGDCIYNKTDMGSISFKSGDLKYIAESINKEEK